MAPVFLALLVVLIATFGCRQPQGEGFAIYLTDPELPASQLATVSHIEIADVPLVSDSDIVSYTEATHEIELTPQAYERIADLQVPVSGRSFVVCVDRLPVYAGAFWTPISSLSFEGVVIWTMPALTADSDRHVIRIELGYPGPDFHSGDDPRAAPEVLESLERAGKLR